MKINLKKAFTLIELMIVVAIIGVIASVAIPSYKNYQQGVVLASLMQSLSQKKTEIVICYQKNGHFNNCDYNASQLLFLTERDHVSTLTIEDGVIDVLMTIKDDSDVQYSLQLRPVVQAGVLVHFSEQGNYCDHTEVRCDRRI